MNTAETIDTVEIEEIRATVGKEAMVIERIGEMIDTKTIEEMSTIEEMTTMTEENIEPGTSKIGIDSTKLANQTLIEETLGTITKPRYSTRLENGM